MSPELLYPELFGFDNSNPTEKSDCYALGMVVYEVLGEQAPFAPLKEHIVMWKVIEGERPERPGGPKGMWFTDSLWAMLGLCWVADAQNRPSITTVIDCLEGHSPTWEPVPPEANEGGREDNNGRDLATVR